MTTCSILNDYLLYTEWQPALYWITTCFILNDYLPVPFGITTCSILNDYRIYTEWLPDLYWMTTCSDTKWLPVQILNNYLLYTEWLPVQILNDYFRLSWLYGIPPARKTTTVSVPCPTRTLTSSSCASPSTPRIPWRTSRRSGPRRSNTSVPSYQLYSSGTKRWVCFLIVGATYLILNQARPSFNY